MADLGGVADGPRPWRGRVDDQPDLAGREEIEDRNLADRRVGLVAELGDRARRIAGRCKSGPGVREYSG
jgi:hypothetical protein